MGRTTTDGARVFDERQFGAGLAEWTVVAGVSLPETLVRDKMLLLFSKFMKEEEDTEHCCADATNVSQRTRMGGGNENG